jgi:hypothetical protein
MKISIKKLHHPLEIKNNGVEFSVDSTDGTHRGDFYVKKAGIVWCPGRTGVKNGKPISWEKLILLAEADFRK